MKFSCHSPVVNLRAVVSRRDYNTRLHNLIKFVFQFVPHFLFRFLFSYGSTDSRTAIREWAWVTPIALINWELSLSVRLPIGHISPAVMRREHTVDQSVSGRDEGGGICFRSRPKSFRPCETAVPPAQRVASGSILARLRAPAGFSSQQSAPSGRRLALAGVAPQRQAIQVPARPTGDCRGS